MDFETYAWYRENGVKIYWGVGTATSCFFLAIGLIYIVIEYCTQSHLSTEDYESAAAGLRMTRAFRKYTTWCRFLVVPFAKLMHWMTFDLFRSNSKSLVWEWKTRDGRVRMEEADDGDGQVSGETCDAVALGELGEDTREDSETTAGTAG